MRMCVLLWCAVALIARPAQAIQGPPSVSLPIASLTVEGAHRYAAPDLLKLSGLTVGQPVTPADIVGAAKRLGATGLFKSLRYRYTPTASDVAVVFEIEEPAWTIPVVFDNFVWFSDDELVGAVKNEVPSFDGTAPATGGFSTYFAGVLKRILDAHQIPGDVEFHSYTDNSEDKNEHYVFRVKGAGVRTCGVTVDGSSAIAEKTLLDALHPNTSAEYSRVYFASLSDDALVRAYRLRGYLRVAVRPPTVALVDDGTCRGVRVTLHVNEGVAYTWDHAEWSVPPILTPKELDVVLDMKRTEPASLPKIDAGLRDVKAAYVARGYLHARVEASPRLDDTTRRAVFAVTVTAGPQYKMGAIEFSGLPDADAARLRKTWLLREGAPYDGTYLGTFMGHEGFALKRRMTPEQKIDEARHVVDVRLTFE